MPKAIEFHLLLLRSMFTKEDIQQINTEFWQGLTDKLGRKKNPHGSKVNWTKYNTGVGHLYFRMEADEMGARLCIDLQFSDAGVREVYYEQFLEFKNLLEKKLTGLKWYPEFDHWNGKQIARIAAELKGVSLFNRSDWPDMQRFLISNFVELDKFWLEFGEVFLALK